MGACMSLPSTPPASTPTPPPPTPTPLKAPPALTVPSQADTQADEWDDTASNTQITAMSTTSPTATAATASPSIDAALAGEWGPDKDAASSVHEPPQEPVTDQELDGRKSSQNINVTPSVATVLRTMPYKVAAKTSGRWKADVWPRTSDSLDIRLHRTDGSAAAMVRVHLHKGFPHDPPVLEYLGPRFDTPLDAQLAMGLVTHTLMHTWTRTCRIIDVIAPAILDVMDANIPLPPITHTRLRWPAVVKGVLELVECAREAVCGRGSARALFVRLGRLVSELEGPEAGRHGRLADFELITWLEHVLERLGGMLVPVKDKKDAISAVCRLTDALAPLHSKAGDAAVVHLRWLLQDVASKWTARQKGMGLSGVFTGVADMWAWVLEERVRMTGVVKVHRTDAVKGLNEESDAVRRFMAGAKELNVYSGPYWCTLAVVFQLLWQEHAVIGARVVPRKLVGGVLSRGFEAMPVDPNDESPEPGYDRFDTPLRAHTRTQHTAGKDCVVIALCLRGVAKQRLVESAGKQQPGGWTVKAPAAGSRVAYTLPIGVIRG